MSKEIKYPYIVFKLVDTYYCVSSECISTIVQLPQYDKIPESPETVTGMFRYRNQVIQMLDLRTTFGFKSLAEECRDFEKMIDARKQDHIKWVNELEMAVTAGTPFLLGRDPHQCALGRWYDSFTSENNVVNFHLRKIDDPHKKLHMAADNIEHCAETSENTCELDKCRNHILEDLKQNYMPAILKLLDETKDVFRSSVYKEMVLLLDGTKWGIVVDEIISVENLTVIEQKESHVVGQTSFIRNVLEREKQDGLIFELNIDALTNHMMGYKKAL